MEIDVDQVALLIRDPAVLRDPKLLEFMLSLLPESERSIILNETGVYLIQKFQQKGSIDDLANGIRMEEKALEAATNEIPDREAILSNLGVALLHRFNRIGSMEDLDRSIEMLEQAVQSTPVSHPNRTRCLSNLDLALRRRFECKGSMDDLNRAIDMAEEAVESTPLGHPDRAMCLNNWGISLRRRFERLGTMDDLKRAVDTGEEAIQLTPVGHPHLAIFLNNLGNALQRRFDRTGSMDDLNRAVGTRGQAVESTPADHPNLASYLKNLGSSLMTRFERTGSMDDLNQAIEKINQAIELTPVGHTDRSGRLNSLGRALRIRFERMGSMDDLNQAIEKIEQAIKSTPVDHPDLATHLNSLGVSLRTRFERKCSMDDLNRAIHTTERAIKLTPMGHPDRESWLNNLGTALRNRFERTGSMNDLNRAIDTGEQSVKSTPVDHPKHARFLCNLGIALQRRFERTGSMNDLNQAIVRGIEAIESIPVGNPDRAKCLHNFGISLRGRFEGTGSLTDLNQAIGATKQAVESTPVGHPTRAIYLNNLGGQLHRRFERTGSMDDLNESIETTERALESTPASDSGRRTCLNTLGVALMRRSERTGSMDDLNTAIDRGVEAVQSTPLDYPGRAMYLNNLANAFLRRFDRTGSITDLNRAIDASKQAVELTPVDHPNLAMYSYNLGDASQRQFERTESTEDLHHAVEALEKGANCTTAPPSDRLRAAQYCADLLIREGMFTRTKSVLEAAVHLLPRLAPRTLMHTDAQFNISQFANLTARAVSLSLESTDEPYKALQLLELGRGILANLQLEVRSDISMLETEHPNLAVRFHELRSQIDSPISPSESTITILDQSTGVNLLPSTFISNRRMLLQEFDDLIAHIRTTSGFENFLKGPSETELRSLAARGPIVVFNVSDIRSDAFLITPDQTRSVHLPLLTSDSVRRFVNLFSQSAFEDSTSLRQYADGTRKMNDVLQGLWDCGVKLILGELGLTQPVPSGQPWPRIWWVTSGLLSILPIHAAGYHSPHDYSQTVLDCVVSSYAFTVKSLSYSREKEAKSRQSSRKGEAILFGMPTTLDRKDLQFVMNEIRDVASVLRKAHIPAVVKMSPNRAEALSELLNHGIVHFACHGYSAQDPSQSSLLLQDWKTSPLTVLDLSSLNIASATFAYLSACHASATRDLSLLDESINLSSAIQLCGYPSVIGSLWQVNDKHSANVAKTVYEWILEDGNGFDARRSAEGLHFAVRQLREDTRVMRKHDPLAWAPFIHVGI